MLLHVPVQIVHSRVIEYQPCLVDVRWSRAIHSCDVCPYSGGLSASLPLGARDDAVAACGAVHYGMCTPVLAPPPFKSSSPVCLGRAPPLPASATGKKRRITVPITVKVAILSFSVACGQLLLLSAL